jgi:hypothetical protein
MKHEYMAVKVTDGVITSLTFYPAQYVRNLPVNADYLFRFPEGTFAGKNVGMLWNVVEDLPMEYLCQL